MGTQSGFKTKDRNQEVRTPQEMSDEAIQVYRETEKDLQGKIKRGQTSLDTLTGKVKDQEKALAEVQSKIKNAEVLHADIVASYDSKLAELKKQADAYIKDKESAATTAQKKADDQAAANVTESARLTRQKQDQETLQQNLDNGIATLKADKEAWAKLYGTQKAENLKTEQGLKDLIAQNKALSDYIDKAKEKNEKLLADLEEKRLANKDIDQKIADNEALLKKIADDQAAHDTRKADLDKKQKDLEASQTAQDQIKIQNQLRQDSLDAAEADLAGRQKVCADREAQLNKGV